MNYQVALYIMFTLSLLTSALIFGPKLLRTQAAPYIIVVSALLILQATVHLFSSAAILVSSLLYGAKEIVASLNGQTISDILKNLRSGAVRDIISATIMLFAWRTGIPVAIGFAKAPEEECEFFLARIETWQSIALFCCLLYLASAIIRISIFSIPLL